MPSLEFEIARPSGVSSARVASYNSLPLAVNGGGTMLSSMPLFPQTPEMSFGSTLRFWASACFLAAARSGPLWQRGQGGHPSGYGELLDCASTIGEHASTSSSAGRETETGMRMILVRVAVDFRAVGLDDL